MTIERFLKRGISSLVFVQVKLAVFFVTVS